MKISNLKLTTLLTHPPPKTINKPSSCFCYHTLVNLDWPQATLCLLRSDQPQHWALFSPSLPKRPRERQKIGRPHQPTTTRSRAAATPFYRGQLSQRKPSNYFLFNHDPWPVARVVQQLLPILRSRRGWAQFCLHTGSMI